MAGALALLASPAVAAAVVHNLAVDVVGAATDPVLAVARNRSGIIARQVAEQ